MSLVCVFVGDVAGARAAWSDGESGESSLLVVSMKVKRCLPGRSLGLGVGCGRFDAMSGKVREAQGDCWKRPEQWNRFHARG